jgi:hypothetical protein
MRTSRSCGRSPLERELLSEARYAVDRFASGFGLVDDGPSAHELEDLAELATVDALAAARGAIVDRAARTLGRSTPARAVVDPVIAPLDPASARIACHAETFDGTYRRQCTRPASFTRDGLPVCRQHARLARIRAAE